MLRVFLDVLLPVFLVAGCGWLLAGRLGVPVRPISRVAFLVLAPSLILRLLLDNGLTGPDALRMAGFTVTVLGSLAVAAAIIGKLAGYPSRRVAALVLVVLLPNAGNYGLPVNRFAFGEPGMAQAGVFFVTASLLTYTVGVFVASLGRAGVRRAMVELMRTPSLYAVALGAVLAANGRSLPGPVDRSVDLLADGCIPVFLLILGMQLRTAQWRGNRTALATATLLRMGGGAALGLLLAPVFGLVGVARQAGIVEASMPAAVITIVLASEYDTDPAFVTAAVTVSTVLSPLLLAPLLTLLGA